MHHRRKLLHPFYISLSLHQFYFAYSENTHGFLLRSNTCSWPMNFVVLKSMLTT